MSRLIKLNPITFFLGFKDELSFSRDLLEQNGDAFTISAGGKTIHVLTSPIHIKHILVDNPTNYTRSLEGARLIMDAINKYSLFTTNDYHIWQKDREALSPLFFEDNVKKYTEQIVDITESYIENWDELTESQKRLNINKFTNSIALKNLLNVYFSNVDVNLEQAVSDLHDFQYLAVKYGIFGGKILGVPMPGYFKCKKSAKKVLDLGNRLVELCLNSKSNNIINSLTNAYSENTISKKHLIEEAITFLFAGHDTTAATLAWAFIYMSLYPDIQQKMHEEIFQTIGERKLTNHDLDSLPYIRAFIFELLRIQPAFTTAVRKSLNADKIGTLEIHKNDNIIFPIYFIHRNPTYWPNPEGFDPNRFLKPLPEQYKYSYLPFGGGPRACIGRQFSIYELVIILSMIVQRYKVFLAPATQVTREPGISNKPSSTIEMTIHSY